MSGRNRHLVIFGACSLLCVLASFPRADEHDRGLVGYWSFETAGGTPVVDGQAAYGISPLDDSLPQPLAHYNFETSGGEAVANGQGLVGIVDDTAGHPEGPFDGFGVDPAALNEGLNYSADVPAALSGSLFSLEMEKGDVVESFAVPVAGALADITVGDFTFHTWFKTTDTGRGVFLGTCCAGSGSAVNFELHTDNRVRTWTEGPSATTDLNVAVTDVGDSRDGEWHSAAAVRRADMVEVWFDGIKIGEKADTAGSFAQTRPTMFFGRDDRTGSTRFGGKLDDTAMWNEALTDEQLASLAAGASPLADGMPAPVVYFAFETMEGAPVTDELLAVGQVDETGGHADGPFHGTGSGSAAAGLPSYAADSPPGPADTSNSVLFDESLGGLSSFTVEITEPLANITMGDMTLHTWFKTTDTGRGAFFGTCCTGSNSRVNFELHTNNRLRFWLNGPDATSDLNVAVTDVGDSRDGKWHAATAVRRGDMVEVWFDGVKIGEKADTAGAFAQSQPTMFFGRDSRTGGTQFDGQLDQITLWNVALEPGDIEMLATRGRIDESGGHPEGPFTGGGVGGPSTTPPLPQPEVSYSADVPAALGESSHSAVFEAANGDESFAVPITGALADLSLGDFTMHTWFKTTDTGRGVFLGSCCAGSGSAMNFELHTSNRIRVWIEGPSATTDLNVAVTDVGDSRDGEWHSAAAVRRGEMVEVWFDGQKIGEKVDTAGSFAQDKPNFFFGRDDRTGGTQFDGKLDDVKLWNIALSPAELADLGTGTGDSIFPSPVAYYAFETKEGSPVADGDSAAGQVDETAGHADGPYHGVAATPPPPLPVPDGLTYSADVSAALAHSASSLEVEERNGDESFSVGMAPALAGLTLGDFSLHAWFKSTDTGRGGIFGSCCTGANSRLNLELHSSNRVRVWVNGPTATTDLNVTVTDFGDSRDGEWHVATAVRRGDTVEMWFDGQLVGEKADTAGSYTLSQPRIFFGRDSRIGGTQFSGKLDDIAMWNVALTPDDIVALASGAVSPPEISVTFEPPAAPVELVAVGEENQVGLDWGDNVEDDFASYTVYRSETAGGPYDALADVAESTFVDTGVTNGVEYCYVVTAVNQGGGESESSSEACATPVEPMPPATPTGLTAVGGVSEVQLDWDDNTEGDLDHYTVNRATSPDGPFVSVDHGVSEFADLTVQTDRTYFYFVTAVDTGGLESAGSGVVEVSTGEAQLTGDCNRDGVQDVSDILCSVGILFPGFSLLNRGTQTPPCDSDEGTAALLDINGDGVFDAADVASYADFLFGGGSAPAGGLVCRPLGAPGCSAGAGCQ